MKRKLLILLLLTNLCSYAQYTLIPDINFEKKLIQLGLDSGTTDGKVLTANISSITSLEVNSSSIKDLTGIENFSGLRTFSCMNNELKSLNLSGSPDLYDLTCSGNPLTTLNITNNKMLLYVVCAHSNLTFIDTSKNIYLRELYCGGNPLTSLDLSQNINLLTLFCSSNTLTKLDISKNVNLSFLNCSDNSLTNLDVSKNIDIGHLFCENNQLTTMDISNNKGLFNIDFSSNKLTYVNARSTNNKHLNSGNIDFRNNPDLTCIQVDDVTYSNANWANIKDATANYSTNCEAYTIIPDINFENKLIELGIDSGAPDGKVLTSKVATVTTLDFGYNTTISDLTGIQDFTALKILICQGNSGRAGDGGNGKLTAIDVSKNVNLTALHCGFNQIRNLDVSKNTALISLNCNVNKLTTLDVSKNVLLDNLNCGSNTISALDVSTIKTLRYLSCDYNQITTLDVSKNLKLVGLDCSNNKLNNLNLKNGTNNLFAPQSLNFKANPALTCIQVDNASYSNTNWSAAKNATASYSIDCQRYTLIPDINFENKLIELGIDSGAPDGKILTSKVATVTTLDFGYNTTISDLTGIQDFTALKILICQGNSGRAGDGGNGKLTAIDVSKNVNLTALHCGFNQITNLDVSKNTALISLNCNVNKLTTLDVSKNVLLDNLNCGSNTISTLDVSTIKTLRYLSCDYNQITTLDVSKNLKLVGLDCSNNKLNNLNLKNGTNNLFAPQSLSFKANPALTCIQVDNASYSTTNWSAAKDALANYNTDCPSNSLYTLIPDLNFENKLITLGIDSGNPDGRVLTASINKLTSLDVSYANIVDLKGLEGFTSLTSLKCNGNYTLKSLDVTKNTALTLLDDSNNYLVTTLDVSKNTSLTSLNCYGNKLSSLDVSNNKNLTTLQLSSNKLTSLDVSQNTALTKLECGYNLITNLDVSLNTNLTALDCTSNKILNLDITKNTKLIELWSGNNQFSSLDVSKNTALNSLICNNNQLTVLDVSKNTALTRLLFYQNKITNIDISQNTILSSFDCNSNLITNLDLSKNPELYFLYCNINKLTTLDVSKNTKLNLIDCSDNQLTILDVSLNKNLTSLKCASNKLVSLNIKNGRNTLFDSFPSPDPNFILYRIDFRNNPDLTCIQVDDVAYSNSKWSTRKDQSANFSTDCNTYTLIADPNFEDFLIAAGIDTDGKNGRVLTSNISNIKTLDVSNSNISDLKGIENFTALEKLVAKGNSISKIDMSANVLLTYLDVSNNLLTSLNVSKNVLLRELYCDGIQIILRKQSSGSNALTTLDVSNNTLLTKLSCSNNQLTSLDLSKNPNLTDLNCSNNDLAYLNLQNNNNAILSNLNFKNNAKLSCLKVDDPSLSNTNWSSVKDITTTYSSTCRALGIDESVFEKVSIYPNPSRGQVNIDNIELEKITVYDTSGKWIKTTVFKSANTNNSIDLKGLPSGVYYIFLEANGAHIVKKIVLQ